MTRPETRIDALLNPGTCGSQNVFGITHFELPSCRDSKSTSLTETLLKNVPSISAGRVFLKLQHLGSTICGSPTTNRDPYVLKFKNTLIGDTGTLHSAPLGAA